MAEAENLEESSAAPEGVTEQETTETIATEDVVEESNVVQGTWPEDWRDKMGGEGDEKISKRLARFGSPSDVLKWALNAEKKISSGQMKFELPDDPSEEDYAAYREANGIPGEWTDYSTDLPEGVVFGEEDKPILDAFLEAAHTSNMPQEYVTPALQWYHELQESQLAERETQDHEFKTNSTVALKEEWGPEYRGNLNALKGLLDGDQEFSDALLTARGADGSLLGDNPVILKWLVGQSLAVNPAATLVPGSTTDSLQSISEEIASIEADMSKDRNAYFKDESKQKRYMDLLTAREKLA